MRKRMDATFKEMLDFERTEQTATLPVELFGPPLRPGIQRLANYLFDCSLEDAEEKWRSL